MDMTTMFDPAFDRAALDYTKAVLRARTADEIYAACAAWDAATTCASCGAATTKGICDGCKAVEASR